MTKSKDEHKKKASVSAKVAPDKLRQIYEALNDEETPFEARVKNVGKGIREVTIMADADAKDIDHFKSVLV